MIDFPSKGSCPKCGSDNTFMKHQNEGDFIKFRCGRCNFMADMKTKEQTDQEHKERELEEKMKKENEGVRIVKVKG